MNIRITHCTWSTSYSSCYVPWYGFTYVWMHHSRERHSFMNSRSGKRRSHSSHAGHEWREKKPDWFSEITWNRPNFYWLMWRALRDLAQGTNSNEQKKHLKRNNWRPTTKINRHTKFNNERVFFFAEIFECALIQCSPAGSKCLYEWARWCEDIWRKKNHVWFRHTMTRIHIFFFLLRKWWLNTTGLQWFP